MLWLLYLLIASHFVADVCFQQAWFFNKKDKNKLLLILHCLAYPSVFVLTFLVTGLVTNPLVPIYIFLTHFLIDMQGFTNLDKDQTLHIGSLVLLWLVL